MTALAVLGAGAWGTALAAVLAARHDIRLWARDPAQAQAIAKARRNQRYLPEIELPAPVAVTADWMEATAGAEFALVATPVAGLRDVLHRMTGPLPFLWLCKGFEESTHLLPHEIVAASGVTAPCGALSGPSFALEVARGLPCALTLASTDVRFAARASAQLHGGRLRIYTSEDVLGVEIGGAVKNVLAIAVGICDGLKLGENARAALVTRGLAELARLGVVLGARADTVMGLTGAGDLVLTATGGLSRNRRVGLELASGRSLADILGSLGHVAEGVRSARATLERARASGIELPITTAVAAVLEGRLTPPQAVDQLLARDPRSE